MAAWILGLRLPAFPVAFSGSNVGRAADSPLWQQLLKCRSRLLGRTVHCIASLRNHAAAGSANHGSSTWPVWCSREAEKTLMAVSEAHEWSGRLCCTMVLPALDLAGCMKAGILWTTAAGRWAAVPAPPGRSSAQKSVQVRRRRRRARLAQQPQIWDLGQRLHTLKERTRMPKGPCLTRELDESHRRYIPIQATSWPLSWCSNMSGYHLSIVVPKRSRSKCIAAFQG